MLLTEVLLEATGENDAQVVRIGCNRRVVRDDRAGPRREHRRGTDRLPALPRSTNRAIPSPATRSSTRRAGTPSAGSAGSATAPGNAARPAVIATCATRAATRTTTTVEDRAGSSGTATAAGTTRPLLAGPGPRAGRLPRQRLRSRARRPVEPARSRGQPGSLPAGAGPRRLGWPRRLASSRTSQPRPRRAGAGLPLQLVDPRSTIRLCITPASPPAGSMRPRRRGRRRWRCAPPSPPLPDRARRRGQLTRRSRARRGDRARTALAVGWRHLAPSGGLVLARIRTAALWGLEAFAVDCEVDVGPGLPGFAMVGLPDASAREARERVWPALRNAGFSPPDRRVVANLAPDRRKEGAAADLALALALVVATQQAPPRTRRADRRARRAGAGRPRARHARHAVAGRSGVARRRAHARVRRRGGTRGRAGRWAHRARCADAGRRRAVAARRGTTESREPRTRRSACSRRRRPGRRARAGGGAPRSRSPRRADITCCWWARRARASRCSPGACPGSCRRSSRTRR